MKISVDIMTMKTSVGYDYYVQIKCDGRSTTPYMFKDRYKAEYHVEHFRWLFGLTPNKPDLMNYDEKSHPNDEIKEPKVGDKTYSPEDGFGEISAFIGNEVESEEVEIGADGEYIGTVNLNQLVWDNKGFWAYGRSLP